MFCLSRQADLGIPQDLMLENAFYGVTAMFESSKSMMITCSTKVCSFGKQVVEKVEVSVHPVFLLSSTRTKLSVFFTLWYKKKLSISFSITITCRAHEIYQPFFSDLRFKLLSSMLLYSDGYQCNSYSN